VTEHPKLWNGRDPTAQVRLGKPARGFYTWSSAPAYVVAGPDNICHATIFGASLGQRVVRAQVDGIERELDWSWAVDVDARPFERRTTIARYLDPVGGAELACHETSFVCVPDVGWDGKTRVSVSNGKPCAPAAIAPKQKNDGPPHLEFAHPAQVLTSRYVPGVQYMVGHAVFVAEIRGRITENWYCPRVEWIFPLASGPNPALTSTSAHEEDCEPYTPERAARQPRRLTASHWFPEGTWTVEVRLLKADRLIARKTATVQVGQSDPNESPYSKWW
jgi:hypothetical protein